MGSGNNESLRMAAEEVFRLLLPENDVIVEEIADTIREAGYETPFTRSTHRERLQWFVLNTMTATQSLGRAPGGDALEEIAFSKSHFEPDSTSVLSPAVALGSNLVAMHVMAQHAIAHYPHDHIRRERALRAIVSVFDSPRAISDGQMRERIDRYKESIIAGDSSEPRVFVESVFGDSGEDSFGVAEFSSREREVFKRITLGEDNATIADRLSISENTVKSHVRNMLAKTRLGNRTQLAILGVACGAVSTKEIRRALVDARDE